MRDHYLGRYNKNGKAQQLQRKYNLMLSRISEAAALQPKATFERPKNDGTIGGGSFNREK